ncbi:MAG TPA: S41 family peptidase [Ktedonobacteraceae bacterium]|nr:S41 family peptidase [Ktedonobacteraceae bacterium]
MGKTEQQPKVSGVKTPVVTRQVMKGLAYGLAAIIIFVAGIGVGNGRLSFGLQLSSAQNKTLPANLDYASVERLYDLLRQKYDGKLDQAALIDGLKGGLAKATGDPYTEYFSPQEAKDFENQLKGAFSGIGAELGKDADNNLVIVAPIDGTPAAEAGLRAQDMIIAIDNTPTTGMAVDEAVGKIRGKKGTTVSLKIVRNKTEAQTVTITRDDIRIPSVKWEVLDGNIGYIHINQFSDDTGELAAQAANEFRGKQVKGVVLDLRDNPGGLLTEAVKVSSLWMPSSKKVLDEKRDGVVVESYNSNGNALLAGIPTAVLINEGSASASEITAGALHDNQVAKLYGVKSYGKGSVQEVVQLPGGGELKVTVARWYRPNGENIDKKGIEPDIKVTMTDDDYKQQRDPQKDAAVNSLR